MELFCGRPRDLSGRLQKEIRVYDLLDSLQIGYETVDHATANTIADCRGVERVLGVTICKNLFLCNRQKTRFYLLMMPGEKPFHTKDLSAQIASARLSFAEPAFMEKYLDIAPGSVSVMGLMNDTENHVQLLLDRAVAQSEFLGCHPCVNTTSMRLRTQDVLRVFLPAVHHEAVIVDLPE